MSKHHSSWDDEDDSEIDVPPVSRKGKKWQKKEDDDWDDWNDWDFKEDDFA